jgi:16S rRNA (cytosine967-C5)-methyltransferase
MIAPARKLAYRILQRIELNRAFSDDALHSRAVDSLEIRDRNLVTEIVYGTLRWQGTLDYILEKMSSRPWADVVPGARVLLRMGVYQMWRMDRIPDHALIFDAVELAKRELGKGIDRYLNGVLRNLARNRAWEEIGFLAEAPVWHRVSLPSWLWDRWEARFGAGTAMEFALSLNQRPQQAFRISAGCGAELPVGAAYSDLVPFAAVRALSSTVEDGGPENQQDEASQLIPYLMDPQPTWRIWDACAAPGGKTAVLRNICMGAGRVVASDLRRDRVLRVAQLLGDTATRGADLLVADASRPAPFRCPFDAVLADAPCSGLGTLRRNPEIKWRFKPGTLKSLQQEQTRILSAVSASVRAGGRLLYSTCSTEPEENEQVVESFLKAHPDFVLRAPEFPPGIQKWVGTDQMVRTFPSTRLWDGFFAALMERRGPQ